MSIIKDANYAKMNYKNSDNTYENLTPKALVNKINYNQNDLCYSNTFRNNLKSTNITDAMTEIEGRVAQCGRKFDELEFGAGKDIDLVDSAGNQITLDAYYIGNIVYLPRTQKYYMLLYSFTYSRSVLLQSDDGLSWNINSESTNRICIDMKCNSVELLFIGYDINDNNGYMRSLFSPSYSGIIDVFNNMYAINNFGVMYSIPTNQYDLGRYFSMSFDMDENSILCLSLNNVDDQAGVQQAFRFDCNGNTILLGTQTISETSGFPKILNINPGQYVYYMRGSKFQPKLISLTKDNIVTSTTFSYSNIYDILFLNDFSSATYLYAKTNTNKLYNIAIYNPNNIEIMESAEYAPPLLLAERCCNNYIFYTNNFRSKYNNRKWAYRRSYLSYNSSTAVSLNDNVGDNIGDNYIIATGFNPSFINKINDKLFIYTNNEVNSTTLNNSKLYISQIKI